MPIDFNNPPVNEVVLATHFNPPLTSLRSEHIGLFWDRIRYDFPTVLQQPPLPPRAGNPFNMLDGELFPMPRFWFIAQDDTFVIQLQKDAFIFNWRRRGSASYPRFDSNIKPAFDKYYNVLDEFAQKVLAQPSPPIESCELTYINSIDPSDHWASLGDTPKVIPSFSVPDPDLNANLVGLNCNYLYNLAANVTLNVGIRSATRPDMPNAQKLIFEIKIVGQLEKQTKAAADEWFQVSHDRINSCFERITSSEMQETYWQPAKRAE